MEFVSPERTKEEIIELFSLDRRIPNDYWNNEDAYIFSVDRPGRDDDDSEYSGERLFAMALQCFGEDADAVMEHFADFTKRISYKIPSLTGVIAIGVKGFFPSDYSSYFFQSSGDNSTDFTHFKAHEWFQLISPLQQERLPNLLQEASKYPGLDIQKVGNGAI